MSLFPQFGQQEQKQTPVPDKWIQGYCVVVDEGPREFDEVWPTVFAALPRVGDFVKSSKDSSLKIIRVAHTINEDDQPRIELNLGMERTAQVSAAYG